MPLPTDIVQGKAWGLWVRDAARALMSSTTPPRRYVMYKGGFFLFQQIAAAEFNNGAPFTFGTTELRWIWSMLERQVKRDLLLYPDLEHDFENRRSLAAVKKHDDQLEEVKERDLDIDDYQGLSITTENRFGRVH